MRGTAQDVLDMLAPSNEVIHIPLLVSQVTAVEKHDRQFVENNCMIENQTIENDATNSCSYLSLGIIDTLSAVEFKSFDESTFVENVSNIILEFPKRFNKVRDISLMPDVREAYTLLSKNNLLRNRFSFTELLVGNHPIYGYELQRQFLKELENANQLATRTDTSTFLVFHASLYVFVISVLAKGTIVIYETHPIEAENKGNGNGIIVKSVCKFEISEWIMKRLKSSNIPSSAIPHLAMVTKEKERYYFDVLTI